MTLDLPRDLAKGDLTRTASTPADYWDLFYKGFVPVDGPAVAEVSYDDLTPGQKAARTRAENRLREQNQAPNDSPEDTGGPADSDAVDTSSEAVDTDLTNQAGDANPSE